MQTIENTSKSAAIEKAIILNDCQVDSLELFTSLFACQPDSDKQIHILEQYHGIVPD